MDFFEVLFGSNIFRLFSPNFSRAFLIFYMFSIIGWICEVLYVGIFFEHKFVNRGFLFGPICPIYGFGGILILMLPKQLQTPMWVLFISGVIFCSAVEYSAGFVLEKLFHTKWWDYSSKKIILNGKTIPLHLHGRICLLNSTLFGIMTVCVIDFIHPLIKLMLNALSPVSVQIIASALGMALFIDLSISIRRLVDFSVYITKLKELGDMLKERYGSEEWFIGKSFSEILETIRKKALEEQNNFGNLLMEKIKIAQSRHKASESFVTRFPSMKNPSSAESLILIREKIRARIEQKKKAKILRNSSK